MIKKLLLFILIIPAFFLLSNCNTNFHKAKRYQCLSPAANYYTLKALWHNEWKKRNYHRHHGIDGIFKFGQAAFIKELIIEDRCAHTKKLFEALNNPADGIVYEWKNKKNETSGRIKMLITKPIGRDGSICREYVSYITIENKIRDYKFIVCNYRFSFNPPLPLVKINQWSFYEPKVFKF